MKIKQLIDKAKHELKEAGIETYNLDARLLLCEVLNKDKIYIMVNIDEEVPAEKEEQFLSLVNIRKKKKPMQYILGHVEFMGIDFAVKEGVLIPRGDTEVLVEEALKNIGEEERIKVLDLCCGSGAIGLSMAVCRKNINVGLVDLYDVPEEVTKNNIIRLNLENRARFIKSDLLKEIKNNDYKYDMIVSNPPYIKEEVIPTLMDDVKDYEPHTALSGGNDGLDFYKRIISDSESVLTGKKILAFEIGYDQGEAVSALMAEHGYVNIRIIKDLAGLDRTVIGNLPG